MLYPQSNAYRSARKLDGYWDFQLDPTGVGQQQGWEHGLDNPRVIAVPASWNEQANELYHYHGRAWYQTRFAISRQDIKQRVVLRFSSVQYTAQVYVNGQLVGRNDAPYLPFEWDVSGYVHMGDNLLVLSVDGEPRSEEPVRICDFYGYAGIARPVFVCILPRANIGDVVVQAGADGRARLRVTLSGAGKDAAVRASIGQERCALKACGDGYVGEVQLTDYTCWTLEHPSLYPLDVFLEDKGEEIDHYRLQIGFRDVDVRGRQILLNGKPVYLKGYGKHEDFCIIGKGLSHALNVRDFDLMRWTGANSFRTSHYPYSEEILDLADREGFLVISEAPFAGIDHALFTNPVSCNKAVEYMRRLIARDRNHPCVLSFCVGNESHTADAASENFFLPVIAAARAMDDRPITYVAWTKPEEDHIYRHVDIVGLNRYYGWYGYENWPGSALPGDLTEALEQMDACLKDFERLYDAPLLVTEFGADTVAGFHSTFLLQFTEEFQSRFLRDYIRLLRRHPAVAGMHVWNFADFATEQSPGRVLGNRKGVFTRDRTPKQAAFVLRQEWLGTKEDGLFSRGAGTAFHVPGM